MKKITGVYKIICLSNNKIYIGSSNNIFKRWNEHIWELNNHKHDNKHLQDAWDKYGEENFKFEIIEECNKDIKLKREQYYLDLYKSYNRDIGFNISKNSIAPMAGRHHTEEAKRKFSETRKGENHPFYGRHHTEETKRKLSEINKGKHVGENNTFYGRHHSEETKKKISESNKGRHLTDEQKQHLSKKLSGSNNPASRNIYVYDTNMNFVNKFDTVNECGMWLLNKEYITTTSSNPLPTLRSMISKSIKNNKLYGGFILSYEPIIKSA